MPVLGPEIRPLAGPDRTGHIGDEVGRLLSRARAEVRSYDASGAGIVQELPELVRAYG